ncbi:OLC1v1038592C1 [Oldenlandia corymbosa var. corymbosa]|uniref:OLC1v1038592C1 n=1 Tax=Oldenlandia corymbosa var. corymbosa TaxID=529605 RepID=A0AAV1D053_OLDCO|nr:OLC1v1038592C1 [Oldenlandia corymbosa var. corymbosa]
MGHPEGTTENVQVKNGEDGSSSFDQHVIVMRHGDRIDNFEPLWVSKASRPWDPPLTQDGKDRAFSRGRKFRNHLPFPIHRLFVSPFLRCLQTAAEVIHGLCAVNDDDPNATSSAAITIDPSKIKVSVEYGLCEMLNDIAIRPQVVPKDLDFAFDISECEAVLPAGTIDHSVERIVKQMPQWGETASDCHARYARVIKALADKYPSENLLLVTHGEGVGSSVSSFSEETVFSADYCCYSRMSRPIFVTEDKSYTAGDFKVNILEGENGLSYFGGAYQPESA